MGRGSGEGVESLPSDSADQGSILGVDGIFSSVPINPTLTLGLPLSFDNTLLGCRTFLGLYFSIS